MWRPTLTTTLALPAAVGHLLLDRPLARTWSETRRALWVSEAVPLHVTSLAIPVVLVVSGVGDADEALAPFFHPIIVLFFAGFLMAEAMRRAGLDKLAAITMVARAGRSPATLFGAGFDCHLHHVAAVA